MVHMKNKANTAKVSRGYNPFHPVSASNPVRSGFRSQWLPPKGAGDYFAMSSDDAFKRVHPVGYWFAVMLGIGVLLLPAILYCSWISPMAEGKDGWVLLGGVGGFIVGVGLFNFVAIILKQYLGHLVSIICFAVGIALMGAVTAILL